MNYHRNKYLINPNPGGTGGSFTPTPVLVFP